MELRRGPCGRNCDCVDLARGMKGELLAIEGLKEVAEEMGQEGLITSPVPEEERRCFENPERKGFAYEEKFE